MQIPKKIHYCWFGKQQIPEEYRRFIAGWKELMPDYEFKLWNESNSPMNLAYMQFAVKSKCWANLSNYVRLHAVYEEGGIYLDTDVEIVKKLDPLLDLDCFFGFETDPKAEKFTVNNAVFGAKPRHPFIADCKAQLLANFPGSEPANLSAPDLVTSLLIQRGLDSYGRQEIQGVHLFEHEYFYPYGWKETFSRQIVTPQTYAIHHWGRSWWSESYTSRQSPVTPSRKKGKSRRLLSIYKRYGLDGVKLFRDGIVRYGPFQNMKFETSRRKPETFAKLIGCFNTCIHKPVYEIMDRQYSTIFVAGCNDGYYGIGFARLFPGANVVLYPEAMLPGEVIEKNISRNDCQDRVRLAEGPCSLEDFSNRNPSAPFLFFSTSEKATRQLLSEYSSSYFTAGDILTALPSKGEAEKQRISKIFAHSHEISLFQERQIPVPIYQYLESTQWGSRLLNLIDRKTLKISEWIFLKSKISDLNHR